MIDDYKPEPSPAIVLRYSENNYNESLEKFYQRHPEAKGKINIVLMPDDVDLKLCQRK